MSTGIFGVIDDHQAQIQKRDRIIASDMVKEYRAAWTRVRAELLELDRKFLAAQARGEEIDANWYFERDRLETLKDTIYRELSYYSMILEATIRIEQDEALRKSVTFTRNMTILGLGPEYDKRGQAVRVPDEQELRDTFHRSSDLPNLMEGLRSVGAEQAHQSVLDQLMAGLSPRKALTALKDAFGNILNHALGITRNETMKAHRAGAEAVMELNANLVEGWKWHARMTNNTCFACVLMHGKIFPVGTELESHLNCLCIEVPIMVDPSMMGHKIEEGLKREPSFEELAKLYKLTPQQVDALKRSGMVGSDYFKSLPPDAQIKMMGRSRWVAWRSGLLDLDKMVQETYSEGWGKGIGLVSMKSLLTPDQRTTFTRLGSEYYRLVTMTSQSSPEGEQAARSLLERYALAEPGVTSMLKDLIGSSGGSMAGIDFRRKSFNSLARKITTWLAGDPDLTPEQAANDIKDAIRYTGIYSGDVLMERAVSVSKELQAQGYKLEFVKNLFRDR
jgi:hypothetical protein